MAEKTIEEFTRHLVDRSGEHIESVLHYPHPFTEGGIILVLRDGTELTPGLLASIYEHRVPRLSFRVLRRSELFALSLPGHFKLPGLFSEHAHLAHWLRHKGAVLYGRDLRHEVEPPPDPAALLDIQLTACFYLSRTYSILRRLVFREHADLIQDLGRQIRYLMATGLLTRGHWDVSMGTIPGLFAREFPDEQLRQTWQEFSLLLDGAGAADADGGRRAALESAWLFERFLRRLKEYAG